jgi:hypothetical protein
VRTGGAHELRRKEIVENKTGICQAYSWQRPDYIASLLASQDHWRQGKHELLDQQSQGMLLPNPDDGGKPALVDFSYLDDLGIGGHAETIASILNELESLEAYSNPYVTIDCNIKPLGNLSGSAAGGGSK